MKQTVSNAELLHQSSLLIDEQIIEIDNPQVFRWNDVFASVQKQINLKNKYIIKVNLVKSTKQKLYFDVVYIEDFKGYIDDPFSPNVEASLKPASTKDISCLIIPTGIGASFGGYAGDANPLAKLFASTNKYLLTHPNVVNGAVLSDVPSNLIYLEGFLLDQFLLGGINLVPNKQNKIGVIFDKGISDERLSYEVNVLNALKAFYGCNFVGWTQIEKSLNISTTVSDYGFSTGGIQNLEYVIEKAIRLKELGATAIAICCAIPDNEINKDYKSGKGIDPIGGVESIISHVVSAACGLVSAHAPVLLSENEKINYKKISPVCAAEYIAKTFLPSVIGGLRFSPQLETRNSKLKNIKSFNNLANIILPYNAFGSAGVFYQNETFQNVILIKENKTCLDVKPEHMNVKFKIFDNYTQMVSEEQIQECGLDPSVLRRPIEKISTY